MAWDSLRHPDAHTDGYCDGYCYCNGYCNSHSHGYSHGHANGHGHGYSYSDSAACIANTYSHAQTYADAQAAADASSAGAALSGPHRRELARQRSRVPRLRPKGGAWVPLEPRQAREPPARDTLIRRSLARSRIRGSKIEK